MENTLFESPEYPLLEKFKKSIIIFVKYAGILFLTVLFIKFLEYGYFLFKGQYPKSFLSLMGISLFYDIVFFFKSLPFLYILFVLAFFSAQRKENLYISIGIIFSVYILIYLLLIKYYFTALVPLGSDLYGYSMDDIKKTVLSSVGFDFLSFAVVLLPFAFLWFAIIFIRTRDYIKLPIALGVMIVSLLCLYFNAPTLPKQKNFDSDFDYNLALNKDAFFFENSYKYFFEKEATLDIYAENYFDDSSNSNANTSSVHFNYVNSSYPFLRTDDTADVLSNFFNIDSAKTPNIVFIQVEGLGRAFSGPNAYLGSFTPFLDQLRIKSLYFDNFLAAQGRTFASLPSVLGSLPFFDKGFNDLGTKMPSNFSLINLLKHNGYYSSYFIATDLEFDNQGLFLRKQGVDKLVSKSDFKEFSTSHNSYWGYPDMDLMQKSMSYISKQGATPFISYIQTISMHTPYKVPEMDKYYQKFEARLNALNLDEATKKERRSNIDQYTCILYADEALQNFIQEFSKLPSYQNTIFLITGDHRLPEIPMSTKLDRYHVPLIIFSPMLKRTASFHSVSSHLDITPSLVKFLKNSYKLDMPNEVTWVGSGLDTARQFRNIHQYPLKQTVTNLIDYISGEYFLNDNTLFSLNDNFNIQPIEDESKKNQLISEFNQYKSRNNQVIKTMKLLPDTLYRKYRVK